MASSSRSAVTFITTVLAGALIACTGDPEEYTISIPDYYEFPASVAYAEENTIQVIVNDLEQLFQLMGVGIDQGDLGPAEGFVRTDRIFGSMATAPSCEAEMHRLFGLIYDNGSDSDGDGTPDTMDNERLLLGRFEPEPAIDPAQNTYGSLAQHVSLRRHVAGVVDAEPGAGGAASIDPLVTASISTMATTACQVALSGDAHVVAGEEMPFYIDERGVNFRYLIEKLMLGAVLYHDIAQVHLRSDVQGVGLLADDETLAGHWDAAFGAFGAARHDRTRDPAEISALRYLNHDEDDWIQRDSEHTFGLARIAADADSRRCADDSWTHALMDVFLEGRARIADGVIPDDRTRLAELREQLRRDLARVIAMATVTQLGRLLTAFDEFETGDPNHKLRKHTKRWARAKGYALTLALGGDPLWVVHGEPTALNVELHRLLGDAPTLDRAAFAARRPQIEEARLLIARTYGMQDQLDHTAPCGF